MHTMRARAKPREGTATKTPSGRAAFIASRPGRSSFQSISAQTTYRRGKSTRQTYAAFSVPATGGRSGVGGRHYRYTSTAIQSSSKPSSQACMHAYVARWRLFPFTTSEDQRGGRGVAKRDVEFIHSVTAGER